MGQHDSTHAAFNARLAQADGYGFPGTPEGATMLSMDAAEKGKYGRDNINLGKCVEAANGGEYHWDVQATVFGKRRRQADDAAKVGDEGVHFKTTNITFLMFQQRS